MRKIALMLVFIAASAMADGAGDWPPSGNGYGHTVQDEGVSLNQRTQLNFTGAGITCTDGSSTTCDVPGPSSATSLDQVGGEVDLRYDATANVYWYDVNGDGTRDNSELTSASPFKLVGYDYATIQDAIDSCGEGTGAGSGCTIILPFGVTNVSTGIIIGLEVGDVDASHTQNGITLIGHGAGREAAVGGTFLCASTLKWTGSNGGTVIQVAGFHHKLENFCIDGNGEAGYGVKSVAVNSLSAPTTQNEMQNVRIANVLDTTNAATGWGISIEGNGGTNNDQNDFWTFHNVGVYNVRHCFQQITGQGYLNDIYNMYCSKVTQSPAINLEQGTVNVDGLFLASDATAGIGISIGSCSSNMAFRKLDVEWDVTGAVFDFPTGGTCGSGNKYSYQITDSAFRMSSLSGTQSVNLINWNRRGTVHFAGNTLTIPGVADDLWKFTFNNPVATIRADATMIANQYQFSSTTTDVDPVLAITSTGGGEMNVLRMERGIYELCDSVGCVALNKDSTSLFIDLDDDNTFDAGVETRLDGVPAANDSDGSLASTSYVQAELTAYASDSKTFTNTTISGGGAHDLGGATSLEIPNGADPTTDATGEIALDNDRYAASRGTVEFYDGTGSVYVVAATDAPGDGQVPKFVAATGTIEWQADADSGAGSGTLDLLTNVDTTGKANGDIIVWNSTSGKWEDAAPSSSAQAWTVADPVLLSTTTSDVVVGTGQVNSGKFTIDGDADQVQLTVQGNATQTDSVVIVENSGGTEVINLDVSGAVLAQSISDIDGPGTLWSIDSSGNATFVSVTTAASTAPTSTFNDSDSASEATDATITAAATDTGAGTEDVDMGFNVQVNSTLTSRLFIDADGLVEVRSGGMSVDASDPADTGAIRLDNAEGIGWEASPTGTDVTLLADASEIIQIANGFLDGDDILADDIDEGQLAATITLANGDLVDFGTNISSATEGLLIPANATSCATATAEAQICWDEDSDTLSVGTGAGTVSFSAGGDNITVDGAAVTDPDFNDGGQIGFTNTANVITADIDAASIVKSDMADVDHGDFTYVGNNADIDANAVASGDIATIVQSMFWGAGAMSTDGTQCATPAEVTINSGPKLYSVICADNDASTMWGSTVMPDGWDGGTVTFELAYVQTAADTSAMNADVAAACRGSGETINSTLGTEQALDDAAVSGSNIVDHVTSAAVTADGTCAAGDTLYWRVQLDATGTTTAVATLNFLGVKMEYTSNVGD